MAAKKKTQTQTKKVTAKAPSPKAAPSAKAKFARAKSAVQKAVKKAVKNVAKRVNKGVQAIPSGYHSLTPSLVVRGANEAMEFYKKAFGATLMSRLAGPGGLVVHAEVKIGDSLVMLSDEMPEMGAFSPKTIGGSASSILIYTKDVDALFNRAVSAGAKVKMPVADMFWGDRYGRLTDPFGHDWQLATHKEDLSEAEMQKRTMAAMTPPGATDTKA